MYLDSFICIFLFRQILADSTGLDFSVTMCYNLITFSQEVLSWLTKKFSPTKVAR